LAQTQEEIPMLKKYTVEYSQQFRKNHPPEHHSYFTDDPIACEEFLEELLERGMGVHAIKHEGVDLPKIDFDRMVKIAASEVASKMICRSLNIKADEERHRFGFVA
jgi:hypothetical protein